MLDTTADHLDSIARLPRCIMKRGSPTNVVSSSCLYFGFPTSNVKYAAAMPHPISQRPRIAGAREIRTGLAERQGSLERLAGEDLAYGVVDDGGAVVAERNILCTRQLRFPALGRLLAGRQAGRHTMSSSVLELNG